MLLRSMLLLSYIINILLMAQSLRTDACPLFEVLLQSRPNCTHLGRDLLSVSQGAFHRWCKLEVLWASCRIEEVTQVRDHQTWQDFLLYPSSCRNQLQLVSDSLFRSLHDQYHTLQDLAMHSTYQGAWSRL